MATPASTASSCSPPTTTRTSRTGRSPTRAAPCPPADDPRRCYVLRRGEGPPPPAREPLPARRRAALPRLLPRALGAARAGAPRGARPRHLRAPRRRLLHARLLLRPGLLLDARRERGAYRRGGAARD